MHPHVWKSSYVPYKRVQEEKWDRQPAYSHTATIPAPPSAKHSGWKLVGKSAFALRTYELTVRDAQGKVLDCAANPEIMLEGSADLHGVERVGEGRWHVRLGFTNDQTVVHVGFRLGGHSVDRFQRMHWVNQVVDPFTSTVISNKPRLRADGKDGARVFLHLKDAQGFPIYRVWDYDLKLQLTEGQARIEGPFTSVHGAYFMVYPVRAGTITAQLWLDGEQLGRTVVLTAALPGKPVTRFPASGNACLAGMAHLASLQVDTDKPLEEEFQRLGEGVVDRFRLLIHPSEMQTDEFLERISSDACLAERRLDHLREEVSRQIRNVALRSRRHSESKGLPRTIWNANSPQAQ